MNPPPSRPGELRSVDGRARRLILAVAPELRSHLGPELLDSGLVVDLYLRLRELLVAHGEETVAPGRHGDLAAELALTLYLFISMRQPAGRLGPDLLVSLRRTLLAALADEGLERQGPTSRGSPET